MRKKKEYYGEDIKGKVILLKNDKMIRSESFYRKWERKKIMNEYISMCKHGTENSYSILIQLNDI